MKGKAVWFLFLFSLAIAPSMCAVIPFLKHYVRIVNSLNNEQLDYHCHSKDDDLGHRTLPPNGEWEFKFHVTLKTKVECKAWHSNFKYYANFTAYEMTDHFDYLCGGRHCIYKFLEDGIYVHNVKSGDELRQVTWTR